MGYKYVGVASLTITPSDLLSELVLPVPTTLDATGLGVLFSEGNTSTRAHRQGSHQTLPSRHRKESLSWQDSVSLIIRRQSCRSQWG